MYTMLLFDRFDTNLIPIPIAHIQEFPKGNVKIIKVDYEFSRTGEIFKFPPFID